MFRLCLLRCAAYLGCSELSRHSLFSFDYLEGEVFRFEVVERCSMMAGVSFRDSAGRFSGARVGMCRVARGQHI